MVFARFALVSLWRTALVVGILLHVGTQARASGAENRIVVFAPASMSDVLRDAQKAFEAKTSGLVVFSFASSSKLARQVLAGAPADLFISAHPAWTSALIARGVIEKRDVKTVVGNRLVIAVRRNLDYSADPLDLLRQGRFSMGDPVSVPAGQYAKQAFQSLGVWESVKENAVMGENVRVALFRLSQGAVAAAVVYESDVVVEPRARVAYTFEPGTHDPIRYSAALLATQSDGRRSLAQSFLGFLIGNEGQAILKRFGFVALGEVSQ